MSINLKYLYNIAGDSKIQSIIKQLVSIAIQSGEKWCNKLTLDFLLQLLSAG